MVTGGVLYSSKKAALSLYVGLVHAPLATLATLLDERDGYQRLAVRRIATRAARCSMSESRPVSAKPEKGAVDVNLQAATQQART